MLPNWLYGKSKSKLAELLGGGGAPSDYNQVKAQVTQNTEDIASLDDSLDTKAALTQITNPNLLDNPWFTVNQRGFTSDSNPSAGTFVSDRWAVRYNPNSGAVTVADNIVTLTSNGGLLIIGERFEENVGLSGKTVTASIMFSDDTIYSGTAVYPSKNGADKTVITTDDLNVYYQYSASSSNYPMLGISCKTNKTISIKAVKLELGSVSTLAMDTAPNYTTELLKCQRYFHKYATEALRPSNMYDCVPEMRATPTQSTITIDSTTYYVNFAEL